MERKGTTCRCLDRIQRDIRGSADVCLDGSKGRRRGKN
jgi:hypothetical protein